jgi:Uma2 family endonuclease
MCQGRLEVEMSVQTAPPIPKLRHGERLSREEFRRRYEAMPDVTAELLDGVVYIMSSPVSEFHGTPHADLITWMGNYKAFTPGVVGGDNTTLHLHVSSDAQPDAYLRIDSTHGGSTLLDERGYVVGPPELIGEVAFSSVAYDKSIKLPIYEREGVREFVLWRVENGTIDWYGLRQGRYELLSPDEQGIVRSEVFPGLWLRPAALVGGNMAEVIAVLQQGVASEEHLQFVEQLQKFATSL